MYTQALLLVAAGVAAAGYAGNDTVVTTTKVVQEYTTYCPAPTHVTMGNKTYTVTEATTLTITDCPCTIVEPCHTCKPTNVPAQPTVPVGPPAVTPITPGTPSTPGKPGTPSNECPGGDNCPPVVVGAAAANQAHYGIAVAAAAALGYLAM